MSFMVLSGVNVRKAKNSDSPLALLAEAVEPELENITGEDGEPFYSAHSLYTGSWHIRKMNGQGRPAAEVAPIINERYKAKVAEAAASLVASLKADLEFVVNIDDLVKSQFYTSSLSRLNGNRDNTVAEMNSVLADYGIPEAYRFS